MKTKIQFNPEQKKQWKTKIGSRFVRSIDSVDYSQGKRFAERKFDNLNRRIA